LFEDPTAARVIAPRILGRPWRCWCQARMMWSCRR